MCRLRRNRLFESALLGEQREPTRVNVRFFFFFSFSFFFIFLFLLFHFNFDLNKNTSKIKHIIFDI